MNRTVKRQIIDDWINANRPNGIGKLASDSFVSVYSLEKIRQGRVPMSFLIRQSLCKVLGVKEDELFPIMRSGKSRAS